MSHIINNNRSAKLARLATSFLLPLLLSLFALLCLPQAQAAAPGITGTTFNLNAADNYIS